MRLTQELVLKAAKVKLGAGSGEKPAQPAEDQEESKTPEPFVLRLHLQSGSGESLANKRFQLVAEGQEWPEGNTGPSGLVEQEVPSTARRGVLRVWLDEGAPVELPLRLGELRPVDQLEGLKARLANLGYYHGVVDTREDVDLHAAVTAFQRANGLEVTGLVDDATRAAVTSAHP